jgi:hypothetical protein
MSDYKHYPVEYRRLCSEKRREGKTTQTVAILLELLGGNMSYIKLI